MVADLSWSEHTSMHSVVLFIQQDLERTWGTSSAAGWFDSALCTLPKKLTPCAAHQLAASTPICETHRTAPPAPCMRWACRISRGPVFGPRWEHDAHLPASTKDQPSQYASDRLSTTPPCAIPISWWNVSMNMIHCLSMLLCEVSRAWHPQTLGDPLRPSLSEGRGEWHYYPTWSRNQFSILIGWLFITILKVWK